MPWTTLCNLSELKEGNGKYVEIDGFRLAVFMHQSNVYVTDNACPHAGGSLADGMVESGCVICPRHDWHFHLTTGLKKGTEGFVVGTYKVRIIARPEPEGDKLVQVDLPMP